MEPGDLLATARSLAESLDRRRPRQANLRRAVSTTYYALFHCLAANCADTLVGSKGADRSAPAWQQVYRALEHGTARNRCTQGAISKFPVDIFEFARVFVEMQKRREHADYAHEATFFKDDVIQDIETADRVIRLFRSVPLKDRRAFAVYLLLPSRGRT